MNSHEISKKASIIFTIFMVVLLGVFTWEAILTDGIEQLRMWTWQSNFVVTMFYVLITYSYLVPRNSFFRRNDKFRFSVMMILTLTFVVVVAILSPLYALDHFWDIGPGAMGYEIGVPTILGVARNIVYHFVSPVFVIWHYLYDKRWRNITSNVSWKYSLPTISYFLFVFWPLTTAGYFWDGWVPYSIMNPEMWDWGWTAVALWMLLGSTIFLMSTWSIVLRARKWEEY